jgi:hypothetical protein
MDRSERFQIDSVVAVLKSLLYYQGTKVSSWWKEYCIDDALGRKWAST